MSIMRRSRPTLIACSRKFPEAILSTGESIWTPAIHHWPIWDNIAKPLLFDGDAKAT